MELNTATLSDFTKLATVLWTRGLNSVEQVARQSGIFTELPIGMNTGDTREFSEIDLEEYASRKDEGDQAARAKVQQGYTKTGRLYRIAKDIGITYEMRSRNKYPEVVRKLTNLGSMAAKRMDLDLTHRLTFGTAANYVDMDGETVDTTVGDGLALFATAHTVRGSSTTFRNRIAGNPAFSKAALESMEQMRRENTINQFGEKMAIPDDIIWTSDDPNTINTVAVVLRSRSNTDDNKNEGTVNVYAGKYRHVVLPRLATDANGAVDTSKRAYWGLCSSGMSTAYLGVHEEPRLKTPAAGNNGEEFSTDDWTFGARAGYMIVVVSANWIGFSSGDAAP